MRFEEEIRPDERSNDKDECDYLLRRSSSELNRLDLDERWDIE